jgi:hypothetical protein
VITVMGWKAEQALPRVRPRRWQGRTFRTHKGIYRAERPSSANHTARYHRGRDQYPDGPVWQAHYSSLDKAVPGFEMARHTTADLNQRRGYVFSELVIELEHVLDLTDPTVLGLTLRDLIGPSYEYTHAIAWTAMELHFEAVLVPSAALPKESNLVIFPSQMRKASLMQEVDRYEVFLDPTE